MKTPRLNLRRRAADRAVELSLDVPSALEYVGPAVQLIADSCTSGILSPRRVAFNLRTALAEALTNAIAYGNQENPDRMVQVRVELTATAVRLHVVDEGAGFDPSLIPDPTLPANVDREDGRGLFVLRHLVDDVAFNDKGNAVCLTLLAG
ncbi:MAG TPA: ATP-binding protein [Gemmatimonadales bacterium]|nr:ATP-binding protein [Gemmatimonadales bacterium]